MNRVLIVGSGDIACRALPWLTRRFRVYALVRGSANAERMRALGATPLQGDLDDARSLHRLAGLAQYLVHCAPPPESGQGDPRTRSLLASLVRRGSLARGIVYISTTGVYGDCQGAQVCETRPPRPQTARGRRRLAAESDLRAFALRNGVSLRILRAPGIYAAERLSLERLQRGDPVLRHEEDVVSNHIHADDLARVLCLALYRGPHLRIYNVCDDSRLKMGDWYDAMADAFGLPRPPRASRAECAQRLSAMVMSFMAESRCLSNARLYRELRVRLEYPDAIVGLREIASHLKG